MVRPKTRKAKRVAPPAVFPPRRRAARRRRPLRPNPGVTNTGTYTLQQREFWGTKEAQDIKVAKTLRFCPGRSGMLVLDGLGSVYDNYVVHSAVVEIVGVGPTTSKAVANVCLDFEPSGTPSTVSNILKTSPSATVAAYRTAQLVPNKVSLMRRNMYVSNTAAAGEDTDAFLLIMMSTGSAPTDDPTFNVFCRYSVTFYHPAPGGS